MAEHLTQASYLVAAALFILSLRWLNHPKTARRGVAAGVAGMAAAIVGTLLYPEIVGYTWIVVAMVVGRAIGVPLSWVPLTAVPQRTALSTRSAGSRRHWSAREVHRSGCRGRAHAVPHRRDRHRSDSRLPHVHRQPDGGRQAAGSRSRRGRSPTADRT